jgi:Cu(I)/Ag(I) efflux system membrane fusion protein
MNARLLLLALALLLAGCGGEEPPAAGESALEHARKHLDPTYICPMHPQIVRGEPGTCPLCGMDLVEREAAGGGEDRPQVAISPAVVQRMGVRTAKAERRVLWRFVRSQGRVDYDPQRVVPIHPRTAGWVETLYVRNEGVRVKRGDTLALFFSPVALQEQARYLGQRQAAELASLQAPDQADPAQRLRLAAGRDLLRYLGVPDMSLMGMESSGRPIALLPLMAHRAGVIVKSTAREGMYAEPNEALFTIADLSQVWVMVNVHEHQLTWVRPGLEVEVSSAAHRGRIWKGKVDFVYPDLDPRTRTLRARVGLSNPDELLQPNMFVEAVIFGGPSEPVLTVPRDAVILTGEREIAVRALGDGRFQPVEVVSGMRRGDYVEILAGLEEGQEVVVSGQFLIDSESSLQASLRRMGP